MTPSALYDTIGRTYDTTRRADPRICEGLARHLRLEAGARVLDVACGTGNYTVALAESGASMYAADISTTMLARARSKSPEVKWCNADAAALPFRDRSFAGATCIWALHHMHDPHAAIREVFRVLLPARFVIFTADAAQVESYWVNEYWPELVARAVASPIHRVDEVERALAEAGFAGIRREPWNIPEDIQDWFWYAGKNRPEIYLDAMVRGGISAFANFPDQAVIEHGCERLRADFESGRWKQVRRKYENDLGDCMFVVAEKRA
jgi:ubiquinone/menaquinone biosynthesis C-methylase UbiE